MRKSFLLLSTALTLFLAQSCKKETVTDICGNTYSVVTIGKQTWMAENLRCDRYDTESEAYKDGRFGIPISQKSTYTPYYIDATDKTKWETETDMADKLSNDQIAKLGFLYNWSAATGIKDGKKQKSPFNGNRQGICPNGWHIPSNADWQLLYDYIYEDQKLIVNEVGTYLKTTSGWHYDGNCIDAYDFAVLPAGFIYGNSIGYVGHYANFWSATPNKSNRNNAHYIFMSDDDNFMNIDYYKSIGMSVRCIKNVEKQEKCKASDYKQVTIGTQTWMAENYACSKYDTESEAYNAYWLTNNTLPISKGAASTPYYADATDQTYWDMTESDNCSGNVNKHKTKLGYLYNWAATVGVENGLEYGTTSFNGNRQGICPNGWHIPAKEEWQTLANYIDGNNGDTNAGKQLKSKSGWCWSSSGTDDYGFAALPSGSATDRTDHVGGCSIEGIGSHAFFWTATPLESDNYGAYFRYMFFDDDYLGDTTFDKRVGLSLRCLKN